MTGGFSEYDWPTNAETDYVCDKPSCYQSEFGEKGFYDSCCYGHYEFDQLLDFINGDKNAGYGLTNAQILSDTNPTNSDYAVSYIYDDFDWDHCADDFDALVTSLWEQNQFTASEISPSQVTTLSPTEFIYTRAPSKDKEDQETRAPSIDQMVSSPF